MSDSASRANAADLLLAASDAFDRGDLPTARVLFGEAKRLVGVEYPSIVASERLLAEVEQ